MHLAGTLLRYDREGGSTTWWPVGLAALHKPAALEPPARMDLPTYARHMSGTPEQPARQAFTPSAPSQRQHWSEVLGVPRDCSTSEARQAFTTAVAALDQADPEYPNQNRRVRDAIDACCREHEIQVTE
jgi:hypothetical protein